MRLIALEIPDDPAELAGWLERHLVGPDLAALVAELEAVHGRASGSEASARGLLGRDLDAVVAIGLSALPPSTLKQLLLRPRLLMELQELILARGGDRWDQLARDASGGSVERGWKRLLAALPTGADVEAANRTTPLRVAWYRRPGPVALATAASVLLAVFAIEGSRPSAPAAWGWDRPGALPQDLGPAEYLARLADAAEDWFRQKPDDPRALARRIAEFRQGCSTLILADHRPLSAEDRAWLTGKCRAWAARLDVHLADVEAGKDPATVRAEADETVQKLIEALRARAGGLAG